MNDKDLRRGGSAKLTEEFIPNAASPKIGSRRVRFLVGGGAAAAVIAAVAVIVVVNLPGKPPPPDPPPAGLKTGASVPCPDGYYGLSCMPGATLAKTKLGLGKDYRCRNDERFLENNEQNAYVAAALVCHNGALIAANEPGTIPGEASFPADISIGFLSPSLATDGPVSGFIVRATLPQGDSSTLPEGAVRDADDNRVCAAAAHGFRATADAVFAGYPRVRSDMIDWIDGHILDCYLSPKGSESKFSLECNENHGLRRVGDDGLRHAGDGAVAR